MRCARPPRSARSSRSGSWRPCPPASEDALLDALDEASAAQLIRANTGGAGDILRRRRQLRLHPRQDPRGALRGAEPDPPPPSAPAHRRNARKAARAQAPEAGGAVASGRARAGPRPSLHARRRSRKSLDVLAPRGGATPSACSRTTRRSSSWSRRASPPRRCIAPTSCTRSTRRSATSTKRAARRTPRSRATSARSPRRRTPRRARRSTPRSERVLHRRRSAGAALPRGSARGARPRDADERACARDGARWAATTTIGPSTARRSNSSSGRGSWPSRSTIRRRCAIIYTFLAGAHQHLLQVRRKRPLGAHQHRDGRAQEVSAGGRVGLRIPGGKCGGTRPVGRARSRSRQRIATRAARPARSRAWPGASSATAQGLHGKGELAGGPRGGAGGAGVVRADRRGSARDVARSAGRRHRGGPGRRRRGAHACRARLGARQ